MNKTQKLKRQTKKRYLRKSSKKHKNAKKSRRTCRRGGGREREDDNELPNPKRTRYDDPMQRFINMVKKINGPRISAVSSPDSVYELMTKIVNLWNYTILNITSAGELDNARQIINMLYDNLVDAVPQQDDNTVTEILNYKSSQMLEELFHYVANIRNGMINEVIEMPSKADFTAEDRDNQDIVYPLPQDEDNQMDIV